MKEAAASDTASRGARSRALREVRDGPVPVSPPGSEHRRSEESGVISRAAERAQIRLMLASYSDILFVLLPFAVVLILQSWHKGIYAVLLETEWSLASAVLAGLASVKLMLGLLGQQAVSVHRERLVFMVAAIVFLLLMPSLLTAALSHTMPAESIGFLAYVHPALLTIAIAVYSGTVRSVHGILEGRDEYSGSAGQD